MIYIAFGEPKDHEHHSISAELITSIHLWLIEHFTLDVDYEWEFAVDGKSLSENLYVKGIIFYKEEDATLFKLAFGL